MLKEKLQYWDDHLNPVLVKEIRQFFHNRLFLSLAAVLLGLQLLLLFIFNLTFEEWKGSRHAGTFFIVIETLLMYLGVFATAVWGGMQRFTAERNSKELDFSNLTLLTPWQIVGGKLASALVVWGLIASLCLPFMTIAYFFRNVTLGEIFLIFGAGFMPMLVLIQGALFCGTIGKKWVYILFLYFAFQLIAPMGIASLLPLLERKSEGTVIFWMIQVGGIMLFVVLLAATIAMVTPKYANRMFPLRLLLCVMMIPALAFLPFIKALGMVELQLLFVCFPAMLMIFFAVFAACDRDEPGGRVLEHVPENGIGRFFHYLFSSNRTGGTILALLMLGILGTLLFGLSFHESHHLGMLALGIGGYAVFYSELGILLNRLVREVPGWLWMVIVAVLLGFLPLLLAANAHVQVEMIITSPFCLLTDVDPVIRKVIYWLGPLAAWLIGIIFVVEMVLNYKNYKKPPLPGK